MGVLLGRFEGVLGYASHLGLYPEQIGPQREALGNFPQGFTNLAQIIAAFTLDRMLGSQVRAMRLFP
jgi:GH15 family glucan-1,4-alpha-glucosidase